MMVPRARPRRARTALLAAVCLASVALLAAPRPLHAKQSAPPNAESRAAFIYHFAQFVRWSGLPEGQPRVIGVFGNPPLAAALEHVVRGRRLQGRPIVVRRLTSPSEVETCQIAYIAACQVSVVQAALRAASEAGVLTVSAAPGFDRIGGIVRLIPDEAGWRFAINVPAAERAGLSISAQLLDLGIADVSRKP
ncbi:MAG: YfiR family protein [Acidobacteriota bacterium]|nr:YfiR family protein [Acidobacteriota bacterium]